MAQPLSNSQDSQSPRPRILQFNKRRYSIRLEPIFWRTLEDLSQRRSMRLGQFVAELEQTYRGRNFSSFLRVYCMLEAEKLVARSELSASRSSLVDVLTTCPMPGVLLSRYRTIISHNKAFAEWLGQTPVPIAGADLTSLVQVRPRRSLNDVWLDMIVGKEQKVDARVLYVAPGRVNAAQATLLAIRSQGDEEFYAIMWLMLPAAATSAKPTMAALSPQSPVSA